MMASACVLAPLCLPSSPPVQRLLLLKIVYTWGDGVHLDLVLHLNKVRAVFSGAYRGSRSGAVLSTDWYAGTVPV